MRVHLVHVEITDCCTRSRSRVIKVSASVIWRGCPQARSSAGNEKNGGNFVVVLFVRSEVNTHTIYGYPVNSTLLVVVH